MHRATNLQLCASLLDMRADEAKGRRAASGVLQKHQAWPPFPHPIQHTAVPAPALTHPAPFLAHQYSTQTSFACPLCCRLVYLATLINGLSYHNAPAKFITMAVCLPLVCGILNILHLRLPHHYAYLFSCAGFTTPIVALSGGLPGFALPLLMRGVHQPHCRTVRWAARVCFCRPEAALTCTGRWPAGVLLQKLPCQ